MTFKELLERLTGRRSSCSGGCCSAACGGPVCDTEEIGADVLFIIRLIVSCAAFAVSLLVRSIPEPWPLVLLIVSAIVAGYDILAGAVLSIIDGKYLDKAVLLTLSAVLAMAFGAMIEGTALLLLYQIGNIFIEYAYAVEGEGLRDEIQDSYDEFRLSQTYLNKPLFIQTDEGIVDNPDCSADYQRYFDQVYKPFIDEYCQGFLTTRIVEYVDLNLYLSRILVFAEVPIAYCVSGILTYYVPNLIFKRGRKTFGKAIYKIGLVDSRLLNPTWQRSLARFAIFYFAILLLSVVTFAVPAIISTTLMGFSKKKQGFADYILDLQEIDTSGATIFNDLEEAAVSVVDTHKKPIDFESIVRE